MVSTSCGSLTYLRGCEANNAQKARYVYTEFSDEPCRDHSPADVARRINVLHVGQIPGQAHLGFAGYPAMVQNTECNVRCQSQ